MPAIDEPMASRWSPSIFDPEETLDRSVLTPLLRAAQWAASSGNRQPWAFLVTHRGDAAHTVIVDSLSRGNRGWVPRAAVVLLAIAQLAESPESPGEAGGEDPPSLTPFAEYGLYGLGHAAAQLTLQAQASGLAAHQFAGFDRAAVAERLGVPGHFRVVAGIAVGHRGDAGAAEESLREREARPRVRRDLAEFVFAGRWGEPW